MNSFDSFSFQSLDDAAETVVEPQTAFVDSLLLPYMHSPTSAIPIANMPNAMQQCESTHSAWQPCHTVPKEELSMSAMYNMLVNRNTGSGSQTVSCLHSDSAPATIMSLLSVATVPSSTCVHSSVMGSNSNSMCVSMKCESSNCSMVDVDREYDTASTVSPFSASTDGGISSDEYPTPSISPLSQSRPAPHIQTQIKLEPRNAGGQGCDEQFSIEIITPPSTVLDGSRAPAHPSPSPSTSPAKAQSVPLKKRASSAQKKEPSKTEVVSQAHSESAEVSRKNSKRVAKRSFESSDENDSDEELEEEAHASKQAKGSSSTSCSAGGMDSKTRLARKAELARMSRRRKKMRLNDLEKEVKRLHEELAQLQKKAKAKQINGATLTQANEAKDTQSQAAHAALTSNYPAAATSSAVNDEAEYAQLMALMNQFVNAAKSPDSCAAADGKQRAEGVLDLFVSGHAAFLRSGNMHLKALTHHVQSILPFQFLNWMCTQGDAFYQDASGLWRSLLVDELQLSAEQLNDMDTFRHTVRKQYKHVVEIQKLFKRMSEAMQKQSAFSLQNMERIRTVLTPQQFAHFIDWVQKFGEICLKMHQ